ncbi:MAG: peptidylprolyl isomerase [Gammaproteobacteria bacterium]|nr:peptidylprolyl isomerase [Gammaproteobacteria bacterium]
MRQILLSLALLLTASIQPAQAAVEELDRIVAVVNEDVITLSELDRRTDQIIQQLKESGTPVPQRNQLQKQLLERMINETIQLELAKNSSVSLSEEELNQVITKLAQDNKLTLLQFRQALINQGTDYEEFREQVSREVIINRLKVKQVDNRVRVSKGEVDNFLKQSSSLDKNREYNLLHILIALPEAATPELTQQKRQQAESILQQLNDGADFKKIAVSFSDGQQALKGGDLGWRKADYLPSLFSDEVLKMESGAISPILRSSSGFHILKLADIRGDKQLIHQVNARHILLSSKSGKSDSELKDRLNTLLERIKHGEDFSALARANSDDRGSAANGGELSWADPNSYVSSFKEMLASLKENEISEPFKSDFGWHIVQLLGRRDHDNSQEVLYNKAYQALTQRKIDEEQQSWSRRLRDEAYVDIRL